MKNKKFFGGAFAVSAALALAACLMPVGDGEDLDELGDPEVGVETLETIVPLFALTESNCTGCHGSSAGMNLSSFQEAFNSFFEIVNGDTVPRAASTTLGAGYNRIQPGNPDSSHLYQRLTMSGAGRMPLVGDPLPAPALERIRKWIADGALIKDTTTQVP